MAQLVRAEHRDVAEEPSPKNPTGLVTILFTDLVGSTALKQHLGDQAATSLIQRHHHWVRQALVQFDDGQEIETAGDSFLLIFAKPSEAVKFALLLQSRLRRFNRENGCSLQDRIGIHLGEVVIREASSGETKRLHGIQVDACARVMSLAQGGQILVTRAVFDNARQGLKGQDIEGVSDLKWLNHGLYSFKGLEEPIEICEVGEAGAGRLSPPTSSEKAQRYLSPDREPVLGWRPGLDQKVPGTQWVLEQKLGEGGFGEVWAARHDRFKERRVFKFCFQAERVRALKREVTLFRLLKERIGEHPNIVRLHDVFFDEPPYYLVEEYVAGKDLATWCRELGEVGRVPLEVRLEIVAQVADALQAAHEAGVIHRDVKPGNILIAPASTPGACPVAKITDFGIGQVLSGEYLAGLTHTGFTQTTLSPTSSHTGTQIYMAPELQAGRPASTRSDIFSLGVVLFQLVVGDLRRPVTTDWAKEVSDPLLREDLQRCFAGNPQDRFPAAAQVAKHLRELPQRRQAFAAQQTALAARERAAYRRGIFRAATVSVGIVGAFAVLAIYASKKALSAKRSAEEATAALSLVKMQKVQDLFISDESASALAYTARFLRENPINRVPAERLLSALSYRSFPLPVLRPLQHGEKVTAAQFSPDGLRVLTTADEETNGVARIWDTRDGRELIPPLRHDDTITSAKFSPEGRRVATACVDGTVRVWDSSTGVPHLPPLKHDFEVNSVEWSQDGQRLVTASLDTTAKIWDAATGRPIIAPLSHHGSVSFAQFDSRGDKVVTASIDGTARIWDARTGRPLTDPLQHKGVVYHAEFSPNGQRVVTVSKDRAAFVWDVRTGRLAIEPLKHEGEVTSAQFSPDGTRIVTGSSDNTARLWNASNGEMLAALRGHRMGVGAAEFGADGKIVVTASLDKSVRIWAAESGDPATEPLRHPVGIAFAHLSPNREKVLTISASTAYLWDVRPGQCLPTRFEHAVGVNSGWFSPDGELLATASDDRTVRVWKATTGRLLHTLVHEEAVRSARFSPDGRMILAVSGSAARIWDAVSGRRLGKPLVHKEMIWSAQFSPDGSRVLTASMDNTAIVWDTRTGQKLTPPIEHKERVWSAVFNFDGKQAATASEDHTARVWDSRSGRALTPPLLHDGPVLDVRFSPDGKRIVTASKDQTARIWDAVTGEPLAEPLKHREEVTSAQFSPDGLLMLTVTEADGSVRVWDALTGKPVTPPLRCDGPVWSAQFSPDGRRIVAASADRTARVWDAQTGQPLTEPLRHNFPVLSAVYSPDGKWVLTVAGNAAYLWPVPPAPTPVPDWFLKFVEAVAGQSMDKVGLFEPVSWLDFTEVKRRLAESPPSDFYASFATWFLEDRTTRAISPWSSLRVRDYGRFQDQ